MATTAPATTTATETATATTTDAPPVKTIDSVPVEPSPAATNKQPASSADTKVDESREAKTSTEDPVAVTVNNTSSSSNNANDGASVNDTQKKIRRAERFGMPVQLSEEEKRNSRAERFGTAPGSQGSNVTKKDEELKRKARAERFGIAQPVSTDGDEKKKARLARFASPSSADPMEEQKKKARALRFSGTNVNGSGKIEPNPTLAGKAGGEA